MSGLFIPLDVEYPSDDEFIEAGYVAELLYIRSLCFCKRKRTNGDVKTSQLATVALGIPSAKKHAQKLVEVGLWITNDDGWHVPAYLKRNPSKQEIETTKALAREAGERGNHERWHIGDEGKPSPKCRLCVGDRIANPIGGATGGAKRGRSPVPVPDTHPVPHPHPVPDTESSPDHLATGETAAPDSAEETKTEQVVNAIIDLRIAARMKQEPPIGNVNAYKLGCIKSFEAAATVEQFVNDYPDAPVTLIAGSIQDGNTRNLIPYARQTDTPEPADDGPPLSRQKREELLGRPALTVVANETKTA